MVAIALFALFLQILLPLGQALALSRTIGDGFSLPTFACTPHGPTLVYDATDRIVPLTQGGDVECPLCVVHAMGAFVFDKVAEIVLPEPPQSILRDTPSASIVLHGLFARSDCNPRAPPAA